MSLREYVRKRNFEQTSEPTDRSRTRKSTKPRFVIQKHAATRLHYDFRLEMDGTLKSWAVPKGIPLKKGEKRLAVHVEDHPLAYADFEGTIPKGQYGGGTVMVWDYGTYELSDRYPNKTLESGQLHFVLHGKKLEGEWGLVRLKYLGLIAAPEGVQMLQRCHPDVPIYLAALDSHLYENAYIVPGLGDAGDRQFGTI